MDSIALPDKSHQVLNNGIQGKPFEMNVNKFRKADTFAFVRHRSK